jgi:uncharacterized protein
MQIEMTVTGLAIDPASHAPIVLLREKGGGRLLPMWIGVIEASAIAFELEKVKLTRPMAHDVLRRAIEQLGGKVERVVVADLRDNTYFASVVLSQAGRTFELEARPSDAIALALRAQVPIWCEAAVIEEALRKRVLTDEAKRATAAPAKSRPPRVTHDTDCGLDGPRPLVQAGAGAEHLLESLEPEAFGKYRM